MSVRNVRVNNFLKETYESSIDKLSKTYVVGGFLTGVYRLPVVFKIKGLYKLLTLIYSLLFNVGGSFCFLYINQCHFKDFTVLFNLIQHLICLTITAVSWQTVRSFYVELYEFDEEIESKFLLSIDSKSNFVLAAVAYIYITLFNLASIGLLPDILPKMLHIDLNLALEMYYYCHLFSLLTSRLKSIRMLLLLSFPTKSQVTLYVENESINYTDKNIINLRLHNSKIELRKLMFLYFKVIKAYDFLNSAIKWQLLIMFATSFIFLMGMAYITALKIIKNCFHWQHVVLVIGIGLIRVVPFTELCRYGEKIHTEVLLLRSALYSRTYNNIFDKTNRSTSSSFLALTEARSLSFSVFRMIEVNISLPFKLLELMVSYVVILLQFQKVLKVDSDN